MTRLQKDIIRILQTKGRLSRKQLVSLLGVTPAAMSQNVKTMIEKSYLYEDEIIDSSKAGRREVLLSINEEKYFFLGIDLLPNPIIIKASLSGRCEEPIELSSLNDVSNYLSKIDLSSCLGVSISKKGYYSSSLLEGEEKALFESLQNRCNHVYFNNNIACLAYTYKYYHSDIDNFLLVKYGPGVGSAIFIDNKLLKNDAYPTFELGQLQTGIDKESIETTISYEALSLLNKNVLEELDNNQKLREKIIKYLSFGILTADTLLQLNNVVVSGEIFQNIDNFNLLKQEINNSHRFDLNKLKVIDNYKRINIIKSVISGIYLYLC